MHFKLNVLDRYEPLNNVPYMLISSTPDVGRLVGYLPENYSRNAWC